MFSKVKRSFALLTSFCVLLNVFIYSFFFYPKILFGGNEQNDKITICHATESASNPFEKIVVSDNAFHAHFENPGTPKSGHEKDFFFEGDVDCPSLNPSPSPTSNPTATPDPTPTSTIIPTPKDLLCKSQNAECDINSSDKECCDGLNCVLFNEVSGNAKCILEVTASPTPTCEPTVPLTPTPTGEASVTPTENPTEKWTICHATSSEVNPYNKIDVSSKSEGGHFDENGNPINGHEEDLLLQGNVDCPFPTLTPTPTPPICNLEYSCSECSDLLISDICSDHKIEYCIQNYDCGYYQQESIQCVIGNNWNCICTTPTPTGSVTPTPPTEPTITPTGTPTITPTVTPTPTDELGLVLEKSNNTGGEIGKGAEFTYEISVENTGLVAFYEAIIKDALPGGFSYISGSSKVNGVLISDPSYENGLLTFNIGDLPSGATKILNYKARATDEAVGGVYYNLAYAVGKYIDPSSGNNVTTQSLLYESGSDDSKVTIGSGKDYSETVGGEVLGTSVASIVLPATGAEILPTVIILSILFMLLTYYRKRNNDTHTISLTRILQKSLQIFVSFLLFFYLMPMPTHAITDTVYIQDLPEYVTGEGFKLSYTALSNSEVIARFFIRKDGDSSWRQFGGTVSGYSGWVQLGGSELNSGDGRYIFRVEINGGTASDETNTLIDRGAPNPVSDYHKEKVAGGFYRLYWRTPDNDDFSRVFIYRSTDRHFTADGTTKVGETGGSKNTNITWENVGLDSNKDYYYAVRTVDKAGNASGLVADPETSTVVGTSASITSEENVKLYPSVSIDKNKEDDGDKEDVLGKLDQKKEINPDKNVVQRAVQFAKDRTKLTLGILSVIFVVLYFVYKRINIFRNNKTDQPE